MSDQDLDRVESQMEGSEKAREIEKERVEMKLMEIEDSVKIPQAVQEGEDLQHRLNEATISGDHRFEPLGIRETPVERMAIAPPYKELPKEAQAQVVKELNLLRDVQDFRARGLSEEEIARMGPEYRQVYNRFYKEGHYTIKGIEFEDRVLIEAGKHHAAFAKEMNFRELPVETQRFVAGK